MASKAGAKHLLCEYEGETILDLFCQLKDKMQYNVSVSIMPDAFRDILEPYAAPIEERLKAVRLCREKGIPAEAALVQPIFTPYLTPEHIRSFFDRLRAEGIINYKPAGFLSKARHKVYLLDFCTTGKRLQTVKIFSIFFCSKIINHNDLNSTLKFFLK